MTCAAAVSAAQTSMPARTIDLQLTGMTCAACAARIEKVLNRAPGVHAAVNFATETAHVEYEADRGEPAEPDRGGPQGGLRRSASGRSVHAARARGTRRGAPLPKDLANFALAAVLTAPLVAQMLFMVDGQHEIMMPVWLQCALATPVQFWAGARFYRGAWNAVRGGAANMDVLVALGTRPRISTASPSGSCRSPGQHVYFEARPWLSRSCCWASCSRDGRRRGRPTQSAPARLAAADGAARARRRREGGAAFARACRRHLCRPRRRDVPVDGRVLTGESAVNESMLTGESRLSRRSPATPCSPER